MTFAKSYDYQAAMRFPLMPGAHEIAWRYIFDWAIAGEALHCAPGERVLEFGAGPSYASEWLDRLGYRTVSLDLEAEILRFAQERMALDLRVEIKRMSFVAGDGQRLPFAPATFDGVMCLNALHHIPDYTAALAEIRRILKPGCRAVFSEPGSQHASSPEARLAVEQYGAVEKNIVLDEIYRIARRVGFEAMAVKPYVYPHLVELNYGELESYRANATPAPYTRPDQITHFLQATHSIFMLQSPGHKVVTSARPNLLRARLVLDELPAVLRPGQEVKVRAAVSNSGDTLWLCTPREFGGHVTLGVKLCAPEGRVLSDTLGRTGLQRDVPPGSETVLQTAFRLPETLAPGRYMFVFDMVDEQIAWFEQRGSTATRHHFAVQDDAGAVPVEPCPSPPTPSPRYATPTQIAGAALAEMGVVEPGDRWLESIARAIHSLAQRRRANR